MVAVLILALVGCTGDGAGSPDPSGSASSTPQSAGTNQADLSAYTSQALAWKERPSGVETATITVPVDYADPAAGDLTLRLVRVMTAPKSDKYLFSNPGGPGSSGIALAKALPSLAAVRAPALQRRYNMLGFDPRGVGRSSPLTCVDDGELDDIVAVRQPATEDGEAAAQEGLDTLVSGCTMTNGTEAAHVSTIEAARDMEIIRQVVGAEQLDYLGYSYGTFLGATYAALYPDKVGRMVLDGVLDPNQSPMQQALAQAGGVDTAFGAWAADCVDSGSCPLGDDTDAVEQFTSDLIATTAVEPMPTGDPERPLTVSLAYFGIAENPYNPQDWPTLTAALAAAKEGDGAALLASADEYLARTDKGYGGNQYVAQNMVNVLDCQINPDDTDASKSDFLKVAPIFGAVSYHTAVVEGRNCGDLSVRSTLESPDYSAPGAAPIVVVGTTRDPATPLENSENLARELDSGVLITRDGDGHTAYLTSDNACLNKAVTRYLVRGTVPEDGQQCPAS